MLLSQWNTGGYCTRQRCSQERDWWVRALCGVSPSLSFTLGMLHLCICTILDMKWKWTSISILLNPNVGSHGSDAPFSNGHIGASVIHSQLITNIRCGKCSRRNNRHTQGSERCVSVKCKAVNSAPQPEIADAVNMTLVTVWCYCTASLQWFANHLLTPSWPCCTTACTCWTCSHSWTTTNKTSKDNKRFLVLWWSLESCVALAGDASICGSVMDAGWKIKQWIHDTNCYLHTFGLFVSILKRSSNAQK